MNCATTNVENLKKMYRNFRICYKYWEDVNLDDWRIQEKKWAYLESNQGPRAYQARALTF